MAAHEFFNHFPARLTVNAYKIILADSEVEERREARLDSACCSTTEAPKHPSPCHLESPNGGGLGVCDTRSA